MMVGYARVSTVEQNEQRQTEALKAAGCQKIYLDKLSGKNANRPALAEMLAYIREGDTVLCESISRLARNTRDLLTIVAQITDRGAEFVSQKEQIDTRTPSGRFMLTVFAAMAELERETILQRQAEGIAIAKAAGRYHGRQKITAPDDRMKEECRRWRAGEQTARETMRRLGLKANTFYRRVREMGL